MESLEQFPRSGHHAIFLRVFPKLAYPFSVSGGDDDVRQTQDFVLPPHPLDNKDIRNTQNQNPNCGKGGHNYYNTPHNL